MTRFARLAAGAVTILAVIAWETLAVQNPAPPLPPAQADVLKMTANLGNGKLAANIANANKIDDVMHQFKPRAKGGIGIGAAPPPPPFKDSIALMINDLAQDKKGFTKDAVTRMAPDLQTMALQTQAIAEINANYANASGKANPMLWKQLNDDMKDAAADLAAKVNNPVAVKAAAAKINTSCVKCHEMFRE